MEEKSKNWGDLFPRLASAMVLIPLAALCVWFGGAVYAFFLCLTVLGMLWEWKTMLKLPTNWRAVLACLWCICALVSAYYGKWREGAALLFSSWILGTSWAAGILIMSIAGGSLLWLRWLPDKGMVVVYLLVAVVMACDSAAYMGGRIMGGPKLAPRISPGKTWSGSLTGLVACIGVGVLGIWLFNSETLTGWQFFYAALGSGIIGVGAQLGDLAESALKRRCGVKDSGSILPGHGGLLDRFDGFLVAGPLGVILSYAPAWGELFKG